MRRNNKIRLTESELRQVLRSSINKVIKEDLETECGLGEDSKLSKGGRYLRNALIGGAVAGGLYAVSEFDNDDQVRAAYAKEHMGPVTTGDMENIDNDSVENYDSNAKYGYKFSENRMRSRRKSMMSEAKFRKIVRDSVRKSIRNL